MALSAASIVYAPAAGLGLLADDFVLLARSSIELVDLYPWEHFRPVPILVWKAVYPVGGVVALHVLNVVLHGANAWMVGLLSYRLGHTPLVAALAAAMFLFLPAAVEPVAWNSGIFDVAAVFFGLYIHAVMNSSRLVQIMGLAALTAAMLSKETAIVLPLIAAALAARAPVNLRTVAISAVLVATYTALRLWSGADAATVLPAGSSIVMRSRRSSSGRLLRSASLGHGGNSWARLPAGSPLGSCRSALSSRSSFLIRSAATAACVR